MARTRAWHQGDPLPEPMSQPFGQGKPSFLSRDVAVAIYATTGAWPSWALGWTNEQWFRESWQPLGNAARKQFLDSLDPPGAHAHGNGTAHLRQENVMRAKNRALQEQLTHDRHMDVYDRATAGRRGSKEPKPEAPKKKTKPETRNMWGGS
jgi:hypothetical protein